MMNQKKKTKTVVMAALFCAMIFLATFILKMTIPGTNGYIHLGDAFILLAAAFLPSPFAAVAAGLGSALADVASGFALYAPFTFIIKLCMTFFITSKKDSIYNLRNMSGSIGASIFMVAGYYITEVILYANFMAPLANIPMNLVQAASGVVIFCAFGIVLDRMHFKKIVKI